jgi:hypothetical protein
VNKVQVKKSPAKTAKPVKKVVVKPVPVEPEIPILMRPSEVKVKVEKKRKSISDTEVIFHVNAGAAVFMAFINALNGGLVVLTMMLMTMAFVTEVFVMAVRDYSEANKEVAKYRNILKARIEKMKKNVN